MMVLSTSPSNLNKLWAAHVIFHRPHIPESSGCVGKEKLSAGAFLEPLNLSFSRILPKGVRFCGLLLTASVSKFLTELFKGLFL